MKKLSIVLFGILLIGVVTSSVIAKTTRYTHANWTYTEVYIGWGPADYYGEDVRVEYTSDNSWTVNQEPGTIDVEGATLRQNLQQKGTVEIYSVATGELLDTRRFICHERDLDEGIDAGSWDGTWYVAWGKDFSKLEELHYEWKIPGVYHFRAEAINGVYLVYDYWTHKIVPPNK